MAKQGGVVNIGLQITDYEKSIENMVGSFRQAMTQISNNMKKTDWSSKMESDIGELNKRIDSIPNEFKKMINEINSQKLNASNFNEYQNDVTKRFEAMSLKISGVENDIKSLNKRLGQLDGTNVASKMSKQFEDLRDNILSTCGGLEQVLGLIEASGSGGGKSKLGDSLIKDCKETIEHIKRVQKEVDSLDFDKSMSNDSLGKNLEKHYRFLEDNIEGYRKLKAEVKSMSKDDEGYTRKRNELYRYTASMYEAYDALSKLKEIQTNRNDGFEVMDGASKLMASLENLDGMASKDSLFTKWLNDLQKMVQESKEATDQIQGTFDTFKVKNGAIHIPIDITTSSTQLKRQFNKIANEIQEYAKSKPVIAKVKLTLDGGSSKSYKNKAEMTAQQEAGQKEPAIDISKSIENTYAKAAREAESAVKSSIKKIQEEVKAVKIPIKPDSEAFMNDLTAMVNSTLEKISKEGFKLNVNDEISKLVESLKEVSTSFAGNEGFKFGLDEASISRITNAIEGMANMIQRAFKVASDSDIAQQWSAIESKFKSVAGEEGKLLKGNKEHKVAIQELAVEYKKYLDMGGKNDLSELTSHKQTIKNISAEYESLGKAAQEAAQQQEKVAKKSASKKVSSEDADAIKGVTKQNKNLEAQADKTSTAIKNEGKSAETAAGKFRKLAKEKGAAVVANRELAKAAIETANALEKEAKARKESNASKNAVGEDVYSANALNWQNSIQQSLLSSGNYEEVVGSKISRSAKGIVQFTAYLRDHNQEWKKLTATVDAYGNINSPKIQDTTEKKAIQLNKELEAAKKLREAMADVDEEGLGQQSFKKSELEGFVSKIIEATQALEELNTKYKVVLNNDGSLSITKEIKEANGEVKTFTANFDSVSAVMNTTTGVVKDLGQVLEDSFDSGKFSQSTSNDIASKYKDVYNTAKALSALEVKISGLDDTKNENQIKELKQQYESLQETYNRLVHSLTKDVNFRGLPAEDVKKLNELFEETANKIAVIEAKLKDINNNSKNDYNNKTKTAFDDFERKWENDVDFSFIEGKLKALREKFDNVGDAKGLKDAKQALSDLGIELKNFKANAKLGKILDSSQTFKDINEIRTSIDSLFAGIGRVDEKSIRIIDMNKLTAEVKKANGEIHKMTVNLDTDGFARFVDNGITQFGRLRSVAEGVFKGIKDMVRIYLSPQDFIRYFKQGFDAVKEVDTAMTELKKVSDAPAGDIAAYFDDATASAKKLGSSVRDMIAATADWSRLGYNLPDSRELGEVAVLYKNVGDGIDIDTANESLVSTIQGFQLQAEDAMGVIDAFNEVSNNYAISSAGIGEALKRSAAAFNAANTDLNQSIALITAGNEIVQSPEKVGTMWQTVSARIRGTKSELEELGEATDDVLSTSKLQSLVKAYTGVDIMIDKDNYKDIYTIVSEIGEKWKELKDVERAALLEALAGKKQSNTLSAVLNNAERLEEIYQTAEGSAGSALKEQERVTHSLQYSLDQLTAHGEEFWNTFINKDDVKEFIDLINTLISGATKLVDTFGSIPTVAGLLSGIATVKNAGIFKTIQDLNTGKTRPTASGFLGDIFKGDFFKAQSIVSEEDIVALESYNELLKDNQPAEAFEKSMKSASTTAQNLAKSAKGAAVDINAIPKASKAAAVGMNLLTAAINVGITMAISVLITGITKMIGAYDEMSQKAADATAKYKEQASSIDGYKDKITELKTELSSENLTYTEARDKRSQLLEIQKQLIDAYGAEAKGIDLVNGALDEQVGKLDKLNAQKRQEWENEVNKLSSGQQWQKWLGAYGIITAKVNPFTSKLNSIIKTFFPKYQLPKVTDYLKDFDEKTNIERITEKVENFKKTISLKGLKIDTEELEKLKTQMDSYEGVSFDGDKMTIAGDAKTVAETVVKIQRDVIGSRKDLQGLNQDLKDVYNAADKIIQENWDTYNQALEFKILDDDTGSKYYEKLTKAAEAYQDALESGNKATINKAKEDYSTILNEISGSGMSETWKQFFMDMYPDLSDIINDWKFEVQIIPKINANEGGLKNSLEKLKDLTTEEILTAFEQNGNNVSDDVWNAINVLNTVAQANGMDLSTLLEQLRAASYLVSELDKRIEEVVNGAKEKYGSDVDWGKYFKDNSIDTEEELDIWKEVTSETKTAEEAMKAYAEAIKTVNKEMVSLKVLGDASSKIKSLGSAFKELAEEGYITTSTLEAIQTAAGLSGEEWENYQTKLLSAKSGSSEFNTIISELTYKILDNAFATRDLTNLTEQEIVAVLRENGVVNASAVAHDWLTQAKAREKAASLSLVEGTDLNITALKLEADQCGITAKAYLELVAKEIIFSNNDLSVEDKIKKLNQIARAAGLATINVEALSDSLNLKTQYDKTKYAESVGATVNFVRETEDDIPWYTMPSLLPTKERVAEYTLPDGTKTKDINDVIRYKAMMDWSEKLSSSTVTPNITTDYSGNLDDSKKEENKALDDYLKKAETALKFHKDELKYIDELQYAYDNLTKTDEERAEILEKMAQAREDYIQREMAAIDNIQSAYGALKEALEEKKEYGDISVDTLQSLLELEPQYINMLLDENGNLVLNEEAINDCTAAYIDNLAAKSALNLIDSVSHLKTEEERLKLLTGSAQETGDALWDLVAAQLAIVTASSSPEVADALTKQVEGIKNMAESAKAGLAKGGIDGFEKAKKEKEEAEEAQKIREDLAKQEAEFAERMADAWKEEHLAQLRDGLEQQKDLIDRYKKNIEVLDFGLQHIETDDFGNRANLLIDKLDGLQSYGMAMRVEFDRIADTMPETGEEAVALADRLEELGSDMRANVTQIRETMVELQQLNVNMASTLVGDRMGELQSELNNIDRRIEILNSDYKDDYQHTLNVLSMDMLLPTYSEYDKKRRDKQKADSALIKDEQETQDKINKIVSDALKRQSEDNAKARAKERQKLVEDMEKTRQEAQKKLDEMGQDYANFLEGSKLATSNAVQEMTDTFANAEIKLPEIDISSVDVALEKAKEKLNNAFSGGTTGNAIIDTASKYNGTPYTWGGGHGSDKSTLDCSGYVSAVLTELGYINGAKAADGFKKVGYRVNSSEMQPGDLLIFDYGHDGNADHVAFYAGDGKMWHSSGNSKNTKSNPGKGVHLANLTDYYRRALVQVNRVYASGTPLGNAKAGRFGLAGENYKPEILIDKATGKATYIDEPTVIDPSKTDVIGEKATARMPKFADGTVDIDLENVESYLSSIKRDVSTIKSNTLPSSYDYDTPTGEDTPKTGDTPKTEDTPSVGELDGAKKIGDWINEAEGFYNNTVDEIGSIEKNIIVEVQNVLNNNNLSDFEKSQELYGIKAKFSGEASAKGEEIYNHLIDSYNDWLAAIENGTAEWSIDVYNAYKDAFANVSELTYNLENGAIEAKKAAAEASWNNSVDWIDERKQKGDWNGDSEYDAWQRVIQRFEKEYPEEIGRIEEAKSKALEARLKNSTDWIEERNQKGDWALYGDSEYEAWQRVAKWLEEEYPDEVFKAAEAKQKAFEAKYKNSTDWIDERNKYNDWAKFGDSEIDAWKRVAKWVSEEYPDDLGKLKEVAERLFDAIKNEFNDANSFANSYLDSQKTILQSHFDVTNSITEARHELNKELETSKTMYEYLDEETRKLLFNQEDYNTLWSELNEIEDKSLRLQAEYEDKIANATLETVEGITSEYQMQYETLMKSYEIAKAELDVAKKKQKLNNVLNERNVRMFINGSWQWVANTEDVANAKSELADAKYAEQVARAGLTQQKSIDDLTRRQNELGVVMKKFEGGIIDLGEAVRLAKKAIGGDLPSDLYSSYNKVGSSYIDWSQTYNTAKSGNNYKSTDPSAPIEYDSDLATMKSNSEAWHSASDDERKALHEANVEIASKHGLKYDEASGKWKKVDGTNAYATGTKYTKGGLALMGEDGAETYITANGLLIPITQPTIGNIPSGGVVFNTDQMKNLRTLWDMSNFNFNADKNYISKQPQQIDQSQDNRIIINGMTVDSGSADGQALISALRRYVGNH